MSFKSIAQLVVAAALVTTAAVAGRAAGPKFTKAYPLQPGEGVFAYARISPNGQFLAYASQKKVSPTSPAIANTVTVVDLRTQKVLFTESGIDAYWSNDNARMIFLSQKGLSSSVVMWHADTGQVTRDIAPVPLGDYFSWAVRDGKNLILTIQSNYYYLNGDMGVMPSAKVSSCPEIGVGDRPLISKDGRRISTFVKGAVVVRGIDNCENTFNTGLQGAKADFSWDSRYVAFHVAKKDLKGYEIVVVDTQDHTVRYVTTLPGSSYFPSWTKDGRLSFRYDGDDYKGFMMAEDVLSVPAEPLPTGGARVPASLTWSELFPETPQPAHHVNLALIWATWSAHSPYALTDMQQAAKFFESTHADVGVVTALELGSQPADVAKMRRENAITLPQIPLAPQRLMSTEALNQIPTTLLFRDGVLVDRRLGAQTFEELRAWVDTKR